MCQNDENNVGFQPSNGEKFVPPKKDPATQFSPQNEPTNQKVQFEDEMSLTEYEIAYYGD